LKKNIFIIVAMINIALAVDFSGYIYNVSGRVDNTLLVDKQQQKLFVLAEKETGKIAVIDTFRITTGKVLGDKSVEGDNKTPEGIYTLVRKLNGDRLPEKYGPLAFVLDYPNFVDRLDRKTGTNIWIHGRNEAIKDRQTEGCISLENSHILDLAKYVTLYETKIIIIDSANVVDQKAVEMKSKLQNFLNQWAEDWGQGNLNSYFANYSEQFRENGHPLSVFKTRKKQLEKIYSWKKIGLDSISFIVSHQEVLAKFQQTYISPRFVSVGNKTLTLIHENDDLKIVKEEFRRTGTRIDYNEELRQFVNRWQSAWETVNIDTFITFYSDSFQVDGKGFEWLYQDKKEKFSRVKDIDVKVSSFNAYSTQENQWVVTFNQSYQADNYKDFGRKTMIVEKQETGDFRILKESWRAGR